MDGLTEQTPKTRHGVMADDSFRLCIVIPTNMVERVNALPMREYGTFSDVFRHLITLGLEHEERRLKRV